jgi:hypothetical protein
LQQEQPLSKRRFAKPVLALVALAGLVLALSACAFFKEGSLQVSQPAGLGAVRVHFVLCAQAEGPDCGPNINEGQTQVIIGVSGPKGMSAPATITATPTSGGGEPIVFRRSDQAAQELAQEEDAELGKQWPPTGTEGIGYVSAPINEVKGVAREWSFDGDFGLPSAPDGGAFGGPFSTLIAYGIRGVGGEAGSADRPVDCVEDPDELKENKEAAACLTTEEKSVGTADLRILPPAQTSVSLGGKAAVAFPFEFAGQPPAVLDIRLTATSTVPQAPVTLDTTSFVPGPPAAGTNRSPIASRIATVAVPKATKPGLYEVTVTAAVPQGGSVTQVAKLLVTKPKIKLGKLKLNKAKGTATLFVKVPAAGAVTVYGKGLAKTKRAAKAARTLKVPVKPNAKTKKQLAETGKSKLKAKISFKPSGAAVVVKSKGLTLKKSL